MITLFCNYRGHADVWDLKCHMTERCKVVCGLIDSGAAAKRSKNNTE